MWNLFEHLLHEKNVPFAVEFNLCGIPRQPIDGWYRAVEVPSFE